MLARNVAVLAVIVTALALSPRLAAQPDDLALPLRQQHETRNDTERTARRLLAMSQLLSHHQLNEAAERKILAEVGTSLASLSREEMAAVVRHLDRAVAQPGQASDELGQAQQQHQLALHKLRELLRRFETLKSLDEVAQRLDAAAERQAKLREVTAYRLELPHPDLPERLTGTGRAQIRERFPKALALFQMLSGQEELAREVGALLQGIGELKAHLPEELQERIKVAEELAQNRNLPGRLREAADLLRHRNYREAAERQLQSTSDLRRVARALRATPSTLAVLKEARERLAKLSDEQGLLRGEASSFADPRRQDAQQRKRLDQQPEFRAQENKQAELHQEARSLLELLQPVAASAVEPLRRAEESMHQARWSLQSNQPQAAATRQQQAQAALTQAATQLDELIAMEDNKDRDALAAAQSVVQELDRLIAQQRDLQQVTKRTERKEQNPQQLPALAPDQRELQQKLAEVRDRPAPLDATSQAALAQAEQAMRAATKHLEQSVGESAIRAQEQALAQLDQAKREALAKISAIAQRRNEVAQLEEANNKLGALADQEAELARRASDSAAQAAVLQAEQQAIAAATGQLAQDVHALDQAAAAGIQAGRERMQAAARALEQSELPTAASQAHAAAEQLRAAQQEVAKALAQRKTAEAAEQAGLQPHAVSPAAAARQVTKALQQAQEAGRHAEQAVKEQAGSAPSKPAQPASAAAVSQALQKSQAASAAAMNLIDQAQAVAPEVVAPQLQRAQQELNTALEQLAKTAPQAAAGSQARAAEQLQMALSQLQDVLAQMPQNGPPGKSPGQPRPGQQANRSDQAKNQRQGTSQSGEPQAGDSTRLNDALGNLRDVRGGSSFIQLPARQRELILQALSEKLPPDYAAAIQQYYVNIATGKPAAGAAAPAEPGSEKPR